MYLRDGVKIRHILASSKMVLLGTGIWGFIIVYLHDVLGLSAIGVPLAPVSTMGIVVSLIVVSLYL